jgi:hypothetical protein
VLIEILKPFKAEFPDGIQALRAGQFIELPDGLGARFVERATYRVRQIPIVAGQTLIWWRSVLDVERGPVLVEGVLDDNGQMWIWFEYEGIPHLLRTSLISRVGPVKEK